MPKGKFNNFTRGERDPLYKILNDTLQNIRKRGNALIDTLNYFIIKDATFARSYLLPEIHKRIREANYF